MSKHFSDYVWRQGLPYGIQPCQELQGITYKIVSDPYHKRNSVEMYLEGAFTRVIYDSALFDFRHIKLGEQQSWHQTRVNETDSQAVSHIRNQDDRLVLIEEYSFTKNRCTECRAFSPQGVLISIQKLYFTELNDPFNGVVLFDANDHRVMSKKYKVDENSGEFTELVEEQWT